MIYVNNDLTSHHESLATATLDEIRGELFHILRTVHEPVLSAFEKIPIWVEFEDTNNVGSGINCFHRSENWLNAHNMTTHKVQSIEIGYAQIYLNERRTAPSSLLDLMAFGMFDRELRGYEFAKLQTLYASMVKSDKYQRVLSLDGKLTKSAARTSAEVYFIHSMLSYLGTGKAYPFVQAELRDYDPPMYEFLRSVWSEAHDRSER